LCDTNAHPDSNTDAHTYSHSNSYSDRDTDKDAYPHIHCYTYCDIYRDADKDANSYVHRDAYRDTHRDTDKDAQHLLATYFEWLFRRGTIRWKLEKRRCEYQRDYSDTDTKPIEYVPCTYVGRLSSDRL